MLTVAKEYYTGNYCRFNVVQNYEAVIKINVGCFDTSFNSIFIVFLISSDVQSQLFLNYQFIVKIR